MMSCPSCGQAWPPELEVRDTITCTCGRLWLIRAGGPVKTRRPKRGRRHFACFVDGELHHHGPERVTRRTVGR